MVPVNELEGYPHRKRTRAIAFSIALVLLAVAASTVLFRRAPRAVVDRDRLPEFSLAYLDGGGSLSGADLEGSPVVLNFWASWCDPCRDEAPVFQAAWERYEPEGVAFLGVNTCDLEPEAKEFVREFGITYPIVRDPEQELADALGIECGLPQTFFVDGTGRFLGAGQETEDAGGVVIGGIEAGELNARIEELLAQDRAR